MYQEPCIANQWKVTGMVRILKKKEQQCDVVICLSYLDTVTKMNQLKFLTLKLAELARYRFDYWWPYAHLINLLL
jgi:hypothetical protein